MNPANQSAFQYTLQGRKERATSGPNGVLVVYRLKSRFGVYYINLVILGSLNMADQSQFSIPDLDSKKASQLFYRDNLKFCCDSKSLWICYFSGIVVYLTMIGLLINYLCKNAYYNYLLTTGWGMVLLLVLICFAIYVYLLIDTLTRAYIIQYTLIKIYSEKVKSNFILDTIKKLIMKIDKLFMYPLIRLHDINFLLTTFIGYYTEDNDLSSSIGNLSICFILNENLNSRQAIKQAQSNKNIYLTSYLFQLKTINISLFWSLSGFLPFLIIILLMFAFPQHFHNPYIWIYLMISGFILAILWTFITTAFYNPIKIIGDTFFYLFLFKNTIPKHCSRELAEIIFRIKAQSSLKI